MKYSTMVLCLSFFFAASVSAGAIEDYKKLREEVWQSTLDSSPLLATQIGDRRGDGKLSDLSLAKFDQSVTETKAYLSRLETINSGKLPIDLQVDYAILKNGFEDSIESATHDHSKYILFTNRWGWFSEFTSLPYRSPFFTLADYESYVGRLEAFKAFNAHGISRSKKAIELGLTQACEPMQGFENRITRQLVDSLEDSPFWAPFTEDKPGTLSDKKWTSISKRAAKAIRTSVIPAFESFLTFYSEEYQPKCRKGTPGVLATSGGEAYYDYRVKSFTTTDMSANEIHKLGLSEVSRIRAEMVDVAKEAGFESREAFIDHLRTDPQYFMTDAEAYVDYVAALAKKIDGFMPKLFGRLPRQPYTVLPIPLENAAGNTTAYYERGSLETGQPGIYRINTTELDQRPLWELPALGVHEAVPGHHHQIALQLELDLHPLRANASFFTAFVEGWGLYSERLGIEMGLYDTPAKEMGRLSYEMWRAVRLVVDTGLHAKGWSKQQAVDYMLDNTALTEGNIDAEVNRYITWPGQALAYKIGELKIRELRARAENKLGTNFDLRAFHDVVLENGAIPLKVLDAHVDRWIAKQSAKNLTGSDQH